MPGTVSGTERECHLMAGACRDAVQAHSPPASHGPPELESFILLRTDVLPSPAAPGPGPDSEFPQVLQRPNPPTVLTPEESLGLPVRLPEPHPWGSALSGSSHSGCLAPTQHSAVSWGGFLLTYPSGTPRVLGGQLSGAAAVPYGVVGGTGS